MLFWLLILLPLQLIANNCDNLTPSTPDEIASLNSDLLFDGRVSMVTGGLYFTETDLHVKAAGELALERTYIHPQVLGRYDAKDEIDRLVLLQVLANLPSKGWVAFPHLYAGRSFRSPYFLVTDHHGTVLEFEIQNSEGILKTASYGCSNLRGQEPSFDADLRNTKLLIEGG